MQPIASFCSSSAALLLLSTLMLALGSSPSDASDSGTFFLKAAKNVPRIGRRSGGGDNTFFLKTTKNVPRIGRRGSPWGAGLTEMRESSGLPWFRNADNPIPSRAVRMGPASMGLWDGTQHMPPSAQYISNSGAHSPAINTAAPEGVLGWHSLSAEQEGEQANSLYRYDVEDDEDAADFSASQLLAPPPVQFQRLPLEGSFPRQRRNEQPDN